MEPQFVSLPAFTLVGMMMRVRPGGKVPGQLWDEFGPRMAEIRHMVGPDLAYGLTVNMDMGSGEFDDMAGSAERRQAIFPYLVQYLRTCRPKDVPQHAEKAVIAVDAAHQAEFIHTLEQRLPDMSASQAARIRRVIKQVEKS
jgi:hypothetical protein